MVKMTLSEGQFLTKIFDFRGQISTFRAENTHKSGSFKAENNAYPTSEHLQNNFQKVQIRLFWPPKWSKWPSQRAYFWPKFLILEVRYRPFELKIHPKVSLLRPKIMPKQLLNISKTTFKKSKKRLFRPPKWSKWPSQRANFWPKILILEVINRPFELKIHPKVELLRPKIMP